MSAPFDVDLMVPKGAETQAVAEVIQAMAGELGIDMKIRVTEFATSLKQAEAGDYQAYLLAWSGRSDPDGNVYSFYKCKAPTGSFCAMSERTGCLMRIDSPRLPVSTPLTQ